MIVVLYRPVNSVTGQTIPAAECSDMAIFYPAKATLTGCGPKRALPIKSKVGDMALPQPIGGGVGREDLAILEIQDAWVKPE
jgi:asparagine synthetase A